MLIDSENALPKDFDSPVPSDSVDDPPRVVVVYRKRGIPVLLAIPLLALVAIGGAIIARSMQKPTPVLVYYVPEALPEPPPAPATASPEPSAKSEPVLQAAPISDPKPSPAPDAVPSTVPAPSDSNSKAATTVFVPEPLSDSGLPPETAPAAAASPPVAFGFDPDALKASASPTSPEPDAETKPTPPDQPPAYEAPPEPPDRPFALDDIQREAKRVADERRRLAAARKTKTIPVPLIDKKLKDERVQLARRDAEIRRRPYLSDLKILLRVGGPDLAERIDALADMHGRETSPALLDAAFMELQGPGSRLTTTGKVQRLRLWGVPEPIILDHLIDTESADVGGRRGPRLKADAIIRAARLLVSIPLPEKPKAGTTAGK